MRAARAYSDEVETTASAWQEQKDKVAELQDGYEQVEKKLVAVKSDRDALLAKLREYDAKVVMTSLDPEVERELVATIEGRA